MPSPSIRRAASSSWSCWSSPSAARSRCSPGAARAAAGRPVPPVSREGALVLNNLLLATAAATVLLGTLYPLMLEAVGGDKVSVGPPFFNAIFVPLMVPLVVGHGGRTAAGLEARRPRRRAGPAEACGAVHARRRARRVLLVRRLTATSSAIARHRPWRLAVRRHPERAGRAGPAVARFRWATALRRLAGLPRAAWGMSLAHAGLAVADRRDDRRRRLESREYPELMTAGQTLELRRLQITLRRRATRRAGRTTRPRGRPSPSASGGRHARRR